MRAIAFGLCLVLGQGICSLPAPAAPLAPSDNRLAVKEAVQDFCADHGITVEGLDRIGDEAAPILTDPQSPLSSLRKMLEGYGYMTLGSPSTQPGSEGLPTRLAIFGRNGSGQQPREAVAAPLETPRLPTPPSAMQSSQSAKSQLNNRLATLAGQTELDADSATAGPADEPGQSSQAAEPMMTNAASTKVSQMTLLSLAATQQLNNLVSALRRVEPARH